MPKLLKETFVQNCITEYLFGLGYHKQEPRGLREHGVDIKVRHKNYGRCFLVEAKGDPSSKVKSPEGSRNSIMNSAIGQIVTRMHTNRKREYKYGYKYGIGFPYSFRERLLKKIPYDVCDKLNLSLFFVDHEGGVEEYGYKKLKRCKANMGSKKRQKFYLVGELADALRVSHMTIYRYIKAGKIRAYKIGKEFRIDKREFNNFLNKVKTK